MDGTNEIKSSLCKLFFFIKEVPKIKDISLVPCPWLQARHAKSTTGNHQPWDRGKGNCNFGKI